MKKFLSLALVALMAIVSVSAKDVSEVRVYLNPGHGSWGPNDRPLATIPYPALSTGRPDTCGFYESNTNLWKVLKIGAELEKAGFKRENIMYSRVKNGPYPYVKDAPDAEQYNRNLTEISEEVEANNFDIFLSVHSNAATDGTTSNYPLFLYRGLDSGKPSTNNNSAAEISRAKASYEFAGTLWPYLKSNGIDPMSSYATSKNIRGDISFYGSESSRTSSTSGNTYWGYLGVLKHGAVGMLSEGYYHTYQPARHRALNADYCRQEGVRYARGIISYFGGTPATTGCIMGTLKDAHEKIQNDLFHYSDGTNDMWLPLNGAIVTLKKSGSVVATYTIDNNYNGVFVFENLAPGNYTLEASATGYKSLDPATANVVVKANETSYPMVFLEANGYIPPQEENSNYPDPKQPEYVFVPDEVTFKNESTKSYTEIEGTVLRSVPAGDNLIVLTDNNGTPGLYLINNTSKSVTVMNTTGLTESSNDLGFISKLSDIALAADGKLIGCNHTLNQFSDAYVDAGYKRGVTQLYIWDSFDAAPRKFVSTQASGNYLRAKVGRTLAVSGPSTDCTIVLPVVNQGTAAHAVRLAILKVENGAVVSSRRNNCESSFTCQALGENLKAVVSPIADDQFVFNAELTSPFSIALSASDAGTPTKTGTASVVKANSGDVHFFRYAHESFMVAPEKNASGQNIGFQLYNVTQGLNKASVVKTVGTSLTAANSTFASMSGYGENDYMVAYLVKDGTVVKFTTKNALTNAKRIYAYDLNIVSQNEDYYTLSYRVNAPATEAKLILKDSDGNIFEQEIDAPTQVGVENHINLPRGGIGKASTWSIWVKGAQIPSVYTKSFGSYTSGRGTVVDKNPESLYFGNSYILDRVTNNCKVTARKADDSAIVSALLHSEWGGVGRSSILEDGTVLVADWNDAKSGIWKLDPANLSAKTENLFVGTRASNGAITDGSGNYVGGSTPGICVAGTGANTKLFVYSEDAPSKNSVYSYNLGTLKTWNKAASGVFNTTGQANANGNVEYANGGVFVSQVRSKGNNSQDVPSLIYINQNNTVTFNSGKGGIEDFDGSENGGFAVSPDNSTLVVSNASNMIVVYGITWNGTTPTLTKKYSFDSTLKPYQMAWDYAGNLYASNATTAVYTLPTADNSCETPARAALILDKPTGVEKVEAENTAVKVYPNPVMDVLTIECSEGLESVEIYSANGALVSKTTDSSVDVSGFSAGVYFVKVNNAKPVRIIKK